MTTVAASTALYMCSTVQYQQGYTQNNQTLAEPAASPGNKPLLVAEQWRQASFQSTPNASNSNALTTALASVAFEEKSTAIPLSFNCQLASISGLDARHLSVDIPSRAVSVSPSIEIDTLCKHIDSAKVQELILKGKFLMQGIKSGTVKEPSKNIEEAQDQLAAICWFLMDAAIKKNQGFTEGAFVIEDIDALIYNFYLKCPHMGARASSHYEGRSREGHFGVDVLNGNMPAQKRHLNFSLVQAYPRTSKKILLHLKPENYSVFPTTAWGHDLLMHSYEYLLSRRRKGTDGDDQPGMQKERVPHATLKTFETIVAQLDPKEIDKNCGFPLESAAKEAKCWGIAYMVDFIKTHFPSQAKLSPEVSSLIQDFHQTIASLDHIAHRTGREVYLSSDELCVLLDMQVAGKSAAEGEGKTAEDDEVANSGSAVFNKNTCAVAAYKVNTIGIGAVHAPHSPSYVRTIVSKA